MTKTEGQFTFLGTGASMGTPLIACKCVVCTSKNKKNRRLRPSALIKIDNKNFLIDSGPDFRQQALCYKINQLEGVLYTHTHYDHIAGIDELRIYYIINRKALPALVSKESMRDIKTRYFYFFKESSLKTNLTAQLNFTVLENEEGMVSFLDLPIQYMSYSQGGMKVTGYRIGNLAYLSDIKEYSETIFEHLIGVEHLIISALRSTNSAIHFNLKEAIDFAENVGARYTWITHISHELEHETTNNLLPKNIQLAYDGLTFSFLI